MKRNFSQALKTRDTRQLMNVMFSMPRELSHCLWLNYSKIRHEECVEFRSNDNRELGDNFISQNIDIMSISTL